jgi:hypothetical protein
LLSTLITFISSGAQYRRTLFPNPIENLGLFESGKIFISYNYDTLRQVTGSYWFVALLLGVLFGIVMNKFNLVGIKDNLFIFLISTRSIFASTNILILVITLDSLLSVFSYPAKWHLIPLFVFMKLYLLILGINLGRNLTIGKIIDIVNIFSILFFVLLLTLSQLWQIHNLISDRSVQWSKNIPVPYDQMADIETEWVRDCYNNILMLKINQRFS